MKRLQILQKLRTKNFTYTKKFYVHEIAAVNLSKIFFLKNAKKTCKPSNYDLNCDWIKTYFEQKNVAFLVPNTYWVIRLLEKPKEEEAVVHSCSTKKKLFWKIFKNSQELAITDSLWNKVAYLRESATLLKKRLWYQGVFLWIYQKISE